MMEAKWHDLGPELSRILLAHGSLSAHTLRGGRKAFRLEIERGWNGRGGFWPVPNERQGALTPCVSLCR